MKILFLIRSLAGGGAERQIVALTKGLVTRGIDVSIAVLCSGGIFERDLKDSGVRVIDLRKRTKWDYLAIFFRLRNIIRTDKPDVVHGYMWDSNVMVALLAKSVRPGKVIFGIRASNLDGWQYGLVSMVLIKIEAYLAALADHVICNSQAGASEVIKRNFPKDRVVVIPNGVDTKKFSPDHRAGVAQRKEWGIPESSKIIGMVARIDPMKDHDNFLRAAAIVHAQESDIHFVCIGNDTDSKKIDELLNNAKRKGIQKHLHFFPESDDIPTVMNAFDILCLPSAFGEGFPNVLAEAMACETTCVATDVGDAAQIIADCGRIVPTKSPRDLAEALVCQLNAIDEPTDNLGVKSRLRIKKMYSLDRLEERTAALFKSGEIKTKRKK